MRHTASGDPARPAILFLHGFLGSGADWTGTISALERRFFCLAPDLPGHGRSIGLPPRAYAFEPAAESLIELLDGQEISSVTLVGYSMGGRLALYLALRHPERCSGLFLESASPGIESAADRLARRRADDELAKRLESGDFEGFLRGWYDQPLFASLERDEALLRKTIEARQRNDPEELARSLRGMGTGSMPPLWGELTGLRVPALAAAGVLDEKFAGISHRMARMSPLVRTVLVPEAGHNVRAEAPDAYLATLEGFLGDL